MTRLIKNKKKRIAFRIILITVFVSIISLSLTRGFIREINILPGIFYTISLILIFISILTFLFYIVPIHNVFFYIFGVVVLSFLFRTFSPGTIFFGYLGLIVAIVGFIIMAFQSVIKIKNNPFISRFGLVINIILILSVLGILFLLDRNNFGNVLLSTGAILFIISILSLFFTLPNSDYLEWTSFHKKFFYRGIVLPMIFVFALLILNFIFPDTWQFISGRSGNLTFSMGEVPLMSKEGL